MREIMWAHLDKRRPVVILTRSEAVSFLSRVTVAPITSTVRGLAIEIPVGQRHGVEHDSVINCDNITTVHRDVLGEHIGYLSDAEDWALLAALQHAFDLLPPGGAAPTSAARR